MKLRPLIEKLNAALVAKDQEESFFHDVATLDQTVRGEQSRRTEERDADLLLAENLLLQIWRMDLYCRFPDAPNVAPDSYLCRSSYRGHYQTSDDGTKARPILVLGGAFEMNRQRH